METLLAISRTLATTLDQDALLRQFLRRMAGAIDADSVGIWTVDETGEWLVPLAGYRVPPDRLEAVTRARISLVTSAFYGDAARSKRPVFSRDVSADCGCPTSCAISCRIAATSSCPSWSRTACGEGSRRCGGTARATSPRAIWPCPRPSPARSG